MSTRPGLYRERVSRADGKTVQVVKKRGHLSYCLTGCCCGHTDRGFAEVPVDAYKQEWLGRRLRNIVHLTKGGCLGPCALANVASLVFDGHSIWFHSVSTAWQVGLIFDYIEAMIAADGYLKPPAELSEYVFDFYDWEARSLLAPAIEPDTNEQAVKLAFLSHADTDLLCFEQAKADLAQDFGELSLVNLNAIKDETQMHMRLAQLAQAEIVLLRLHGSLESVPAFQELSQRIHDAGHHLVIVSGLNELNPAFAKASNVPTQILQEATHYLAEGGIQNSLSLAHFLSDRLCMSAYGYASPRTMPAHGFYHPNLPEAASSEDWFKLAQRDKASAIIVFYRAHYLSGNLNFIDTMIEALEATGLNAVGVFTSSLRDTQNGIPVALENVQGRMDVLISTLAFAAGKISAGEVTSAGEGVTAFENLGIPVIQAISSGVVKGVWQASSRGLNALDTAMNVALPEFDGRIITVPVSFKERGEHGISHYVPDIERCQRLASIASRLAKLRHKPNNEKRVAFVLTNSGAKASTVGNAVGLDAPASLMNLLHSMKAEGYQIADLPSNSDALIFSLLERGSYDEEHPLDESSAIRISRQAYLDWFRAFPDTAKDVLRAWWGEPSRQGYALSKRKQVRLDYEPYSDNTDYLVAGLELDNIFIGLQPPRGYGMDPDSIYHTPDLPPTHHYSAFYRWLASSTAEGGWGADAIIHVGKHGTLEWLPGKGVGLSKDCFPDILLADLPLIYPFIINDPGEGSQSKRRAHAVVVDHLTPPLSHAETYGELAELAQLVNEYYAVEKLDPGKLPSLQQRIWQLVQDTNLKADLDLKTMLERDHGDHKHEWDDEVTEEGIPVTLAEMDGSDVAHLLEDIDGYLCELGLAQIRDGLHVLGEVPPFSEMLRSLTRLSNAEVPSLQEELAKLLGFDLDTLVHDAGKRLPKDLLLLGKVCYAHADILELIDNLSLQLFEELELNGFNARQIPDLVKKRELTDSQALTETLAFACNILVPNLEASYQEITATLAALSGRYVPAGPSGAPSRGMAHILPTGRNFYAVDPRALPSASAWQVGEALASELIERHLKESGEYPSMIALSAWGTSAMRTHGDDVAEALALLGVKPRWNKHSKRIEGLDLIPLDHLKRPRIDVTVRVSGFFRDAFPHLLNLLDDAVKLVIEQDEPLDQNYPKAHYLKELAKEQENEELTLEEAEARASYRVFGSKPGTYGAGILGLIEQQNWSSDADFATAFLAWGGYAYGRSVNGAEVQDVFAQRLKTVTIVAHNQDNREHDIFDSDDYFQFMGGMVASVRHLSGQQPKTYFGDSSSPNNIKVRDLREETLRVYRSRVVNPKWLEGIQRHGYKGALEMTATVDYLFGFDATAHVAPDFIYEGLAEHYALDEGIKDFLEASNPWALKAIAERLLEAVERGLWASPNPETLDALKQTLLESEGMLEEQI